VCAGAQGRASCCLLSGSYWTWRRARSSASRASCTARGPPLGALASTRLGFPAPSEQRAQPCGGGLVYCMALAETVWRATDRSTCRDSVVRD